MSELTRRLKAVDPDLKVIPGGTQRHHHHTTQRDWKVAGGLFCKQCKQETVRIFSGLCLSCHREAIATREKQQEDRAERRYYRRRLSEGTIALARLREGRL